MRCYHAIMIRQQIQFTSEQARALREAAHRRGVSVSALVREATAEYLAGPGRDRAEGEWTRAMRLAGAYRSGADDVARDHDRYLADLYAK